MISERWVRRAGSGALVAMVVALSAREAGAAEYWVAPAPTGSDSNAGTMAAPFATLQKGHDTAVAGDTVWIRGGTYAITTPRSASAGIQLSKSGTSDANRIKFWAVAGEKPVFDFVNMQISANGYTNGFSVSGSWLHIRGIEIKNVPMLTNSNNGMSASGSNNIFELIDFHHINGTGLFISGGMGGNLILNCDSHDNYDPTSSQGDGQNADGFGVHYQEQGNPTIIRGCRAWWNSDDGYDLINHEVSVTIENSWAFGNGYANSGMDTPADGNGTGFKAGSSETGVRHIIRGCLAWGNRANGFYANHSLGGNTWYNNTSINNGTQYNMLATDPVDSSGTKVILTGDKVHIMRNNIGFPNRNRDMEGVDTASNSWDLMLTPANSDFVSVMDTGHMAARNADGSLPNIDFMKLSATSKFIDRGVDVMLPYAGMAPDLGCYETGLPMGGMGGGAGTAGAGGAGSGAGGVAGSGVGGGAGAGASGGMGVGGVGTTGGSSTGGAATAGSGPSGGGSVGTGGASAGTTATGGAGGSGTSTSGAAGSPSGAATGDEADAAGCGCRTSGRGNGAIGVTLAALLLAALRRRRR
jgi:MYXO-CTERM domain-containing protein